MKKIFFLFLIFFIVLIGSNFASVTAQEQKIELVFHVENSLYTINGIEYQMDRDVYPLICKNRTFLPIRFVVDPIGAFLSWEGHERKVIIGIENKKIELWIDNPIARVNGIKTQIDSNPEIVPFILQGRTMLPIRFIAENLGAQVNWDAETKEIEIIWTTE
ncbi:MAG: copper amine oxidase N-terminal domain-containing protein [Candidatus Pacebacteria bacterium]|nr:copper amine oxidase N-terminal domain-containing protein [Candidatus Paceibacterota bacterium]